MFARVTKYVVAVFLAAASCFSGLYADDNPFDDRIVCTTGDPFKGDDGKWYVTVTCRGKIDVVQDVPVETAPSSGGCTNCTAMSPQQCELYKENILTQANDIISRARSISDYSTVLQTDISSALTLISMIQTEGDEFYTWSNFGSVPVVPGGNTQDGKEISLNSTPQSVYFPTDLTGLPTPVQQNSARYGVVDGVYKYYNQGVKPLLDSSVSSLMSAYASAQRIDSDSSLLVSDVGSLMSYVNDIPCAVCPGGGSGDSGGGGGSSGACPCSEVLNAIKALLEEKRDILKDWNDNQLPKLKERLDYWQSMLKVIQDAVAPIGTNFLYAVQYKDLDGVTFQMKQLDQLLHNKPNKPNEFDFTAFKNYSWFTRVEYLLMSIAGVYSVTNRDDDLTQAGINEAYSDIADKSSTLETKVQSIKSNVTGLHTAFKGLFTALKSSVSTHDGSGTVTLSASWFEGRGLTFTLPSGVTGSLRTITSLLWTIIFVVVMDQFLLYAWISFSYVYRFCVRQMTDFVK